MLANCNDCNILYDIIDILSRDEKKDNIDIVLQMTKAGLSLDDVFIIEPLDVGSFKVTNACAEDYDYLSNKIKAELNRKFDSACVHIEENQKSILVFKMKVRGMIPTLLGFVRNTIEYSWSEYEEKILKSLCNMVKCYLIRFNIPNTDPLTGMPSLTDFAYEIERRHDELGEKYAVVISDIASFKNINDIYGHEFGDVLIKYIADVIKKSSRADELYSRITADKFITVMRYSSDESIIRTLRKTTKNIYKKFPEVESSNCRWVTGVYIFTGKESSAMQAIDNATYALKIAKMSDTGYAVFYDKELEEKITRDRYMVSNMKQAIANEEFVVYFQPLFDLKTSRMIGSEALVRWINEGEIIPPSNFIPLFEENNFMSELDFYVYEKVCKYLSSWIKSSLPVFPVSVNVSRVHLKEADFGERLIKLINKYNIPHNLIELEITENIFITNMDDAIFFIQQLKAQGFVCAIDDFGSGFSSLNILRHLPVDILKLDKEFLNEDISYNTNQLIVYHIIQLAKSLNLRVLAEGVETEKQMLFLQECDCDMAQGYFFARPMPVADFTDLIKAY